MEVQKTHWKKLTNPDYLGSYSFNEKEEKILTIKQVKTELVCGSDGKKEQCTVARFFENEKPMILNKTNCKIITKLYSTPYIEEWGNRKIQIYVDSVKAFGEIVEALRIRARIPQVKTVSLTCSDCGENIQPSNGKTAEWLSQYTSQKYGKPLCSECAKKEASRILEADDAARLSNDLDNLTKEETVDEPDNN